MAYGEAWYRAARGSVICIFAMLAACGGSAITYRTTYRVPGPYIGPGVPLFPTVLEAVQYENPVTDQDPRVGELIATARAARNAAFVVAVHEYEARGIKRGGGLHADIGVTIALVVDGQHVEAADAPRAVREEAAAMLARIRQSLDRFRAPMM